VSAHPIVAFATEVLRFPLRPRQAAILDEIYADNIRTAVLRLGRRSGKGRIGAVVATYEATANAPAHLAAVPEGEQVAIVVLASSQRQARYVHKYIRGFLERSPELAKLLVNPLDRRLRDTLDEIELSNGIVIMTLPCHAASARGQAVAVVILDEAAWFQGRDGSPLDAKEIWDALAPATLQFPAGRILVLSTPRWSTGWFAEQCELAASGRFPDMRHWHATTAEMDPRPSTLAFLESERAKDPPMFAREYDAEFNSGVGAVFDSDLVRAARRPGGDLSPQPGIAYVLSIDAAFTGDTFSALVGHREPSGRIVVDRIRGWRGSRAQPVQLESTLDEIAQVSLAYNGAPALIDQYAAEPIRQGLAARSIRVLARPWTNESKVDAVAAVRQVLYGGALSIPEHRELIAELSALEQRPTPGGRPRIAAPGSGHDDYATALMALCLHLGRRPRVPMVLAKHPDTDRWVLVRSDEPWVIPQMRGS
jgi:hypothetical protein